MQSNYQLNYNGDLLDSPVIPVTALEKRYSISRSNVWYKIHALNMKAQRINRASFLTPNQVKRLDALHVHMQEEGNTMASFVLQESGANPNLPSTHSQLEEEVKALRKEVETLKEQVALLQESVESLTRFHPVNR